jgi:type I restriction enzyme R subunit
MPAAFTESVVEEAALAWLRQLGYEALYGPNIGHDWVTPERADYRKVPLRLERPYCRGRGGSR